MPQCAASVSSRRLSAAEVEPAGQLDGAHDGVDRQFGADQLGLGGQERVVEADVVGDQGAARAARSIRSPTMSANVGWPASISAVRPCTWVGPGSTPGFSRLERLRSTLPSSPTRQRRDADDARLPRTESGRLDVDDRPARAGLGWPAGPRCGSHVRGWHGAPDKPRAASAACRRRVGPLLDCRGWSPLRGRIALAAGSAARWASRVTGRGAGAMIGGLVAMTLDKSILRQLGRAVAPSS